MKQQDALYQYESSQIHKEETNDIFEIENDKHFKPHFGNNCMFRFYEGPPQLIICPHFLGVNISLIMETYFISSFIQKSLLIEKSQNPANYANLIRVGNLQLLLMQYLCQRV